MCQVNVLLKVTLIYIVTLLSYSCILFGFGFIFRRVTEMMKSFITRIIKPIKFIVKNIIKKVEPGVIKTANIISKYFYFFIIAFMMSGVWILIKSNYVAKDFSLCISIFSLSISMLVYGNSLKNTDSRNIEYYIEQINNLNLLHKSHFIDDETYSKKMGELNTKFNENQFNSINK